MNLRTRSRDLAIILPLGALAIFLPPYLRIFDQPVFVLGIPLLPLAIFTAWLVGIVLTLFLSRLLTRASADEIDDGQPPPAGPDPGDDAASGDR